MGRIFDVLIVDDDPGQPKIIRTLMGELGLKHQCHYAPNGQGALDFLYRRPPFETVPRPHLILLDLHMPGMDGCEVLRQVKSDPELCSIPIVMLSSSPESRDVDACYREHANAFIEKPKDIEGHLKILREIDHFWAERALVPGQV